MFQFYTQDQEMLRKIAREFVEAEIAPMAAEWDEKDVCPKEMFPKLGQLGFLGIFAGEEYGGAGLGLTERAIVLEEIARHSAGLAIAVMTHDLAIAAMVNFANEDQKKAYLPQLISGEKVGGVSVTEPTGGSDFANQATTMEKDGDNWVINGRKVFITNSHICDIDVWTGTSGTDEKGRPQITAVVIPEGTDGHTPGRHENKFGLRGSVTGEVICNDVKVPLDCLVGKEGQGGAIALHTIGNFGRSGMSAIAVGILRGCVEESVKFAQERVVYGKPISKLQAIQFIIADNQADYAAAECMLYNATTAYDKGLKDSIARVAATKLFTSEVAVNAAKRSMDLMGGYGIVNEYPQGRFLRDAMTVIPSGATSHIQRLIVAGDTIAKYK